MTTHLLELNKETKRWPKIERAIAAFAQHGSKTTDGAIIHCTPGGIIASDMTECGLWTTEDCGLTRHGRESDPDHGIWCWEGKFDWLPGSFECPQDGGYESRGNWRELTEREWECVKKGENPFEEMEVREVHPCPTPEHHLLGCPFCGGSPSYRAAKEHGLRGWTIECSVCSIKTKVFGSQALAQGHWNTRSGGK